LDTPTKTRLAAQDNTTPIPHWKTISRRTIAKNPFLTIEEHSREEDVSGKQGDFIIVQAPNWGNIVALTEEGAIVLVEQFRHGSETIELEVPGGVIGESEDPGEAVLRELTEETGYERTPESEFIKLGEITPNPAFIDNTCFMYLVTNVRLSGETSFDEHENIRVRLVPREAVDALVKSGEIRHALTAVSLYFLRLAGY
jgi:8-oxo-dGTP pyrophosphatase MutT (NUDIX family)